VLAGGFAGQSRYGESWGERLTHDSLLIFSDSGPRSNALRVRKFFILTYTKRTDMIKLVFNITAVLTQKGYIRSAIQQEIANILLTVACLDCISIGSEITRWPEVRI